MSSFDCDSELRYALDLPFSAAFSSGAASMPGRNRNPGGDARIVANTAPGQGEYGSEVLMRRQELLSEIADQVSRPSLSADERDYLSRLSSTISTLNIQSVSSIDVLKLCIVCARFFPGIDIRAELALLKSEIEAFLMVKASGDRRRTVSERFG